MNKIRRDWNDLLFTLQPATALGLFRIAFGLIVVAWCVLMVPSLKIWYSEDGFFNLAAMHTWEPNGLGFDLLAMRTWCHSTFGVWLFSDVTDYRITLALFVMLAVSALCVAVGYKTRTSSILLYLLLVTFHHRDSVVLNGGDDVQRNMAFLLMFSRAGAACSIDRLIRIARGEESADAVPMVEPWPLLLMRLQVAAVYITTVACKLQGDEWRNGTALYYALHLVDMERFPMFGLQNRMEFIYAASYLTLLTEFSLGTLIWIPRARPYVLAAGVALHLGIEYSMNIPLFAYTMIGSYLTFVRQSWVDRVVAWSKAKVRSFAILVPARAPLPGTSAGLLKTLDVCGLVQASDTVDGVWDAALVNRVLLRFPFVWALFAVPLFVIILIEPTVQYLILTGIAWPLTVAAIAYAASRAFAAWIVSAELAQEAELLPVPRKAKRSPTRAH
jgi:hypothetical protein